jgi:hypothetical protein
MRRGATVLKLTATLKKISLYTLEFEPLYGFQGLVTGLVYDLDIKEHKANRSLEQNRMIWGIIQQIAQKTGNDEMDIYISGLEAANVKYEFILALPETETALKRTFRAVKPYGTRLVKVGEKELEMVCYKCYIGSSKMDTQEMTLLLDYFIRLAAENGIEFEGEHLG